MWDAATWANLAELKSHTSEVSSTGFSLEGMRIVTELWDNTVQLRYAAKPRFADVCASDDSAEIDFAGSARGRELACWKHRAECPRFDGPLRSVEHHKYETRGMICR